MKHFAIFLILVVSLVVGSVPVGLAESPPARVALEKPAPAFTLKLLSGETVRLSDFRGQVLVLNFWHSG